jgi:hypothetical protein
LVRAEQKLQNFFSEQVPELLLFESSNNILTRPLKYFLLSLFAWKSLSIVLYYKLLNLLKTVKYRATKLDWFSEHHKCKDTLQPSKIDSFSFFFTERVLKVYCTVDTL